ncbi:MAG: AI-2E family transporter [Planctomycetaceae bacterium]|nr:AI-2E family transporter [Planctomycetaceae bacterium]
MKRLAVTPSAAASVSKSIGGSIATTVAPMPARAPAPDAETAAPTESVSESGPLQKLTLEREAAETTAAENAAIPISDEGDTSAGADGNGDRRRQRRQSVALVVLAAFAVLSGVYLARAILMPIVMGCILTLLLRPLVRRGRKHRIPDACTAALALAAILIVIGMTVAHLVGPARHWIDLAPRHLQQVGDKLRGVRDQFRQISQASNQVRALAAGENPEAGEVQKEPSLLEKVVRPWTSSEPSELKSLQNSNRPIPVEVRQPGLTTGLSVLSVTGGFLAGGAITVVLTFFLLANGDRLLNNVLHLTPSFREKRNIVEMIYEVERGVSSYLLTVTLINIGLGIAVAIAMWLMMVPNPALWGAMATVLNFVPYLGAFTGTVTLFLVAVFSFDSLSYACLVPLVYFSLTALEGNFVTPSLLGRRMSMNPVVVFVSLVFWGWIWGVGGALIAVPVLAILKIAFDQFERTQPLGTLLGD